MSSIKFNLREILQDLQQQKIDLHTLINELCDHIEEHEPSIHALVPESDRRSRLLNEAEELVNRFPDPNKRPPLFGLPVGVKDIIRVDGFPTKAGSKLPEELFEGKEAVSVTLLKEVGALIIGKTETTEFAFFEPGPTANPHNINHTPGGSSSGSAAGVAAGFFTLAFGTQTIGSVIRPAAFCGVVGFKPTLDRISTNGLLYFSRSIDHIGLFSQNMEEMEISASVVCQGWDDQKVSSVSGRPILGVPEGPYLKQMPAEGLAQFEAYLKQLEEDGYVIKRVPVFENIERINRLHNEWILYELANEHREWFDDNVSLYRPFTRESILKGQKVAKETADEAKKAAHELRLHLHKVMDENKIDLWVCPPALGTAPKGLHATGDPIMNLPWTNTGMPSISLPVGVGENGLPLGLQFVAQFGYDEQLLAWAKGLDHSFKSKKKVFQVNSFQSSEMSSL